MFKTYGNKYITKFSSPLACYVYEKATEMLIDKDDECWSEASGETMELFGKRIVSQDSQGFVTLEKFPTISQAQAEFNARRFPSTGDAVIYERFAPTSYTVYLNDGFITDGEAEFPTLPQAIQALAQMMQDAEESPQAWFVSDYGTYSAIDDEVSAHL